MMLRLLFWLALGILVVFAIRTKLRAMTAPEGEAQPGPPGREGETMACCAHCHLYFPASEAVHADGLDYCSPAHVRLPPR